LMLSGCKGDQPEEDAEWKDVKSGDESKITPDRMMPPLDTAALELVGDSPINAIETAGVVEYYWWNVRSIRAGIADASAPSQCRVYEIDPMAGTEILSSSRESPIVPREEYENYLRDGLCFKYSDLRFRFSDIMSTVFSKICDGRGSISVIIQRTQQVSKLLLTEGEVKPPICWLIFFARGWKEMAPGYLPVIMQVRDDDGRFVVYSEDKAYPSRKPREDEESIPMRTLRRTCYLFISQRGTLLPRPRDSGTGSSDQPKQDGRMAIETTPSPSPAED
jgi:hypothetical protein